MQPSEVSRMDSEPSEDLPRPVPEGLFFWAIHSIEQTFSRKRRTRFSPSLYALDQPTDDDKANVGIRDPDLDNAGYSVGGSTLQDSTSLSPKVVGSQLKIPEQR